MVFYKYCENFRKISLTPLQFSLQFTVLTSHLHGGLVLGAAGPRLEARAGVAPDARRVAVSRHLAALLAPRLGEPPVAGEHHDAGGQQAEGEGRGQGHDQEQPTLQQYLVYPLYPVYLSHLRGVGCAGDLPVVWQRDPELHVLLPALGLAQVPHLPPPPHAVTLNIGEALRPAVYLLDTRYNLNI